MLFRSAGVKRFVELPVSGAFHSPLMQLAADRMRGLLAAAPLRAPRVPVITNVSAAPVEDPDVLRRDLIEQITHAVRWTESMNALVATGVDSAVEVGPGAVLKGLMRRIARDVPVLSAGGVEEIELTVSQLEGKS